MSVLGGSLLQVDKETATLIAAATAAVASLLGLFLRSRHERLTELRVAHRKALEPLVEGLGDALHEIVAASNILLKPMSDKQRPRWLARSQRAQATLRQLRPRLRYPLWGLDLGLRSLIRLPDWVSRRGATPANTEKLIRSATYLREAIDYAVRNCYRYGRQPNLVERTCVAYRTYQLRRAWGQTRDAIFEEGELSEEGR